MTKALPRGPLGQGQPGLPGPGGGVAGGPSLSALAPPPPAVVRKLNELYKASVVSCQGLSLRLQRFFLDKQRLLDRIQSVTAEKLIFSHAVQTVGPSGGWHLGGGGRGGTLTSTACWTSGWGMTPCCSTASADARLPWPSTVLGAGLAFRSKQEASFSSLVVGECSPAEACAG